MTLSYTLHFRFAIPDFLTSPWHSDWEALVRQIDEALFSGLISVGGTVWANSTAYAVGHIVISPQDGSIWVAAVAHTSAASPTTFSADRTAHPTFWSPVAPITPSEQLITVGGSTTVAVTTGKVIINKSVPSVTPLQLPLSSNFLLQELIIYDWGGNGGDITVTPGLGDRIGGLAPNAPWTIASTGGAGLGGGMRLTKCSALAGWLPL